MRLQHIDPLPPLKGYIEKLWVFESSGRLPDADLKLIAPNGLIKLVIPFRNGLSGAMEGCSHLSREHSMTLIGICDLPSVVVAQHDAPAGTIGIEFSPRGAYRFFHLQQTDLKNKIYALSDVLGKTAKELEEQIANAEGIAQKVKLVQQFLFTLFCRQEEDTIFEHCTSRIQASKGMVSVAQLEKETGYSSRWLNHKFEAKLGISPKNLCSLTRFQYVYQSIARNDVNAFRQTDLHQLYYDQAHFIREFKRFTGLSPGAFEKSINDFGKIFYKD